MVSGQFYTTSRGVPKVYPPWLVEVLRRIRLGLESAVGKHCNDFMQHVYKKHGPKSFSITVLENLGQISEKEAGSGGNTIAGFSDQQKAEVQ